MNTKHPTFGTGSRKLRWAGFLLGFSLGGFFDGILLHQVLQWHHLLSNVQAAAFQDIRVQLLADGVFHVLMYVIAAWALYLLWKARADYAAPGADRVLWSQALKLWVDRWGGALGGVDAGPRASP